MSRYLPKNTKTGDFKQQRTLSGSFFVIPEHLASIRAVVLAFTENKQTNEHSQLYIRLCCVLVQCAVASCSASVSSADSHFKYNMRSLLKWMTKIRVYECSCGHVICALATLIPSSCIASHDQIYSSSHTFCSPYRDCDN